MNKEDAHYRGSSGVTPSDIKTESLKDFYRIGKDVFNLNSDEVDDYGIDCEVYGDIVSKVDDSRLVPGHPAYIDGLLVELSMDGQSYDITDMIKEGSIHDFEMVLFEVQYDSHFE